MIPAVALTALLLSAAPARRDAGTVAYATAARAYLDAGAEDGLTAGAELALRRGGAPAGRCTVEAVAAHHATCTGGRARAGDTFALPVAGERAPPPLLPPPPPDEVLARRRAVVAAAPVALVVARPSPAAPLSLARPHAIDVSAAAQAWAVSPGGTSGKESLDVLARGVPLTPWLYLDLDARLEHVSARAGAASSPATGTRVYLWQAQLTAVPGDRLTLSGGRILPWGVPGATVFDGAMAGWRGQLSGARAEVGAFGGEVPSPDRVGVDGRRYTGGAYWILDRQAGGLTLRSEGRLAAVHTPELGTRGEGSLTARAFARSLDLSAEANLGAGGRRQAPGLLDSARLDATLRPRPWLRLGGSLRYSALDWPQADDPPALPGRTRAADAFVTWDAGPWLRLGAAAGAARDAGTGVQRSWFGPEASLTRILWGRGTLGAGYLEERGSFAGRSAYLQLAATPLARLWLLGRAAWSHERAEAGAADEASLTLGGRAELGPGLALRLTLSERVALAQGEESRPSAFTASGALQGAF